MAGAVAAQTDCEWVYQKADLKVPFWVVLKVVL